MNNGKSAGTEAAENKSGRTATAGEGRGAGVTTTGNARNNTATARQEQTRTTRETSRSAAGPTVKGTGGSLLEVRTEAEMQDRLQSMLREPVMEHGVEEEPEGENTTENTTESAGDGATPGEHEPAGEAQSPEELEGEEEEAQQDKDAAGPTGEEEDPEGETEEDEEAQQDKDAAGPTGEDGEKPAPKDWPKSAVREVTELRQARRELRAEKEKVEADLNAAMSRLESEELKRPLAPTPSNPLAFAETPEKLEQWAGVTERRVDQIEAFLDDGLSGRELRELTSWAEQNGATTEDGEIDKTALKALKRDAREALTKHVPARRQYFEQERALNAATEKDPLLGPVWTNKTSPEYRDAMAVVQTLPELRRLPHWKGTAALIAIGLREMRKAQGDAAKGKEGETSGTRDARTTGVTGASRAARPSVGNGANGKAAATGANATARQESRPTGKSAAVVKPKGALPTVKGAGRTVLPRHVTTDEVEVQNISKRLATGEGTIADAEALTRRALTGKVK